MKLNKPQNFGVMSQGVSECTKLFQVQIIHSRQLPKPRSGHLGICKSCELFLSICFMFFHIWADTSSRHASVVVHAIFMAQEVTESIKKQAQIHTYAYIPHTQSECKRVLAKG